MIKNDKKQNDKLYLYNNFENLVNPLGSKVMPVFYLTQALTIGEY
jgi:hypothetical protein